MEVKTKVAGSKILEEKMKVKKIIFFMDHHFIVAMSSTLKKVQECLDLLVSTYYTG